MKISIEKLSSVQKKITFEIPADQVQAGLEKAYRAYQNRVRLKGFRAGRVPRHVLERRFGEEIAAEVSSTLVEESLAKAIEEHELAIVTKPQIVAERLVAGNPFCYSAMVETKPEVKNVDYEGIAVDKVIASVAEKEVDESLTRLAESFAQLHPVTDREQAESGDVVTLDYRAVQHGHAIPGLEGKGRLVELGKESLLPGFQEKLAGAKKGQTVEFSLPMPQEPQETESEPQEDIPTATFHVTIHDIAQKEVPLLDDEFAKDHGECDTLEELRAKIRENMEQMAERTAEGQMHDAVLSQILSKNPFEVPPVLVREQAQQLFVESGLQGQGNVSFDDPTIPEAIREDFSQRAKRQIETTLLLDALVEQLGITSTEEEVDLKIGNFGAASVEQQQQVETFYADPRNRQMLQGRLCREKALEAVVGKAHVRVVQEDIAGAEEND
jgi:trigger factor